MVRNCVWPVGNWLVGEHLLLIVLVNWQVQVCTRCVYTLIAIASCCICRVLLDVMCLLCVVCFAVNLDTDDQRLAVIREIQRSEDIYLSNVQLLLENYYEPLR